MGEVIKVWFSSFKTTEKDRRHGGHVVCENISTQGQKDYVEHWFSEELQLENRG